MTCWRHTVSHIVGFNLRTPHPFSCGMGLLVSYRNIRLNIAVRSCGTCLQGSSFDIDRHGVRSRYRSAWCLTFTAVVVPSNIHFPSSTFCGVNQGFIYAGPEGEVSDAWHLILPQFMSPLRTERSTYDFPELLGPVIWNLVFFARIIWHTSKRFLPNSTGSKLWKSAHAS